MVQLALPVDPVVRASTVELHLSVQPKLGEPFDQRLVLFPDRDLDLIAAGLVAVERSRLAVAGGYEELGACQARCEVVRVVGLPDLFVVIRIAPQRSRIFTRDESKLR